MGGWEGGRVGVWGLRRLRPVEVPPPLGPPSQVKAGRVPLLE